MARDGTGDVDHVHHRAAENEPQGIRVVRQNDLNGFGCGVLPALRLQRSPVGLSAPLPVFVMRNSLRSRSIDTRYGLRNLWPTMPPTWKPRRTLGACRLSTTTAKFL